MIKSRTSKKSSSSLTIPINELIIRTNVNTKPTKYNVPMVVNFKEKPKGIYFADTNHSIAYTKINHDFLMHQIDTLLDECHVMMQKQEEDTKYDNINNQVEYEEMILKIKSKNGDSIFTCLFLVSISQYHNPRSSHLNLIPFDTFVKFLERFQNFYDKLTSKHEQKMKLKSSFGRVNTSSTTDSTSFHMTQKKNNSTKSQNNHATYGRKRQMKLQRQLDQMLKDNHSDDENYGDDLYVKEETDPTSFDNDVCALENEEEECDRDNVDKDVKLETNKKRRKIATSGRRLVKKSRTTLIQDEDSDDDLDFENDVTTSREKNSHEMKSTDLEMTQTNETIVERTPAIVSPAHQNNNSDKRNRRLDASDDFSDAITEASDDEEKAHNESIHKDAEKDEKNESEQANTIKNFFAPKKAKSKVDVIKNTGIKKSDINVNGSINNSPTKSKYFSSKMEQTNSADRALARRPQLTPKSSSPSSADRALAKRPRSTHKSLSSSSADRAPAKSPLQTTKSLSPKAIDKTNLPQATTKNLSSPIKSPKKTPQKTTPATKAVVNPYKSTDLPERSIHIGLKNLGNTCYLNSSLQMIFSVPDFIESLKQIYNHHSKDQNDDCMPLTRALLKIAWDANIGTPQKGMANSSGLRSVDPREVKEAIDTLTDKFTGYEQRDAHEFASTLIDYIHDELVKVTKDTDHVGPLPTDEFFKLDVKVCLTCNSCKYTRSKEELYRHLSIEIGENQDKEIPWSVDQSLDQFFTPEVRELRCEKCESGTAATQTIQVMSRPKALLLHLKRFIINDTATSFHKNKARVSFTKTLSLDRFSNENINDQDNGNKYNLCGVVCHLGGTASSGHYTANCVRMKKLANEERMKKEWISFDDAISSVITSKSIYESERNQRAGYMLLYSL